MMNTHRRAPTIWVDAAFGRRTGHQLGNGSSIVGRDPDVPLLLPSDQVSRRHAELYRDGERLSVRDLGSQNGTTVNGRPVTAWVELADGDVVRFADVEAVVEIADRGSTPPPYPQPTYPQPLYRQPTDPQPPYPAERPDTSRGGRPAGRPVSTVPVFVSHSSEDKATVRHLARYLKRHGWRVWIDEAGIAGGKAWHSELIRALESTWVVLLVVSIHSMRSRWVIREVQAADRLGLQIIPVAIDDAPYPDELRMILSGVQQLNLTERDDTRRNQQLSRLDRALIQAGQSRRRRPPGRGLIAVGTVIGVIGVIGVVVGFGLFIYLGFEETSVPSFARGIPPPVLGWGLFAVSALIAAIGEALRRAGLKKGI